MIQFMSHKVDLKNQKHTQFLKIYVAALPSSEV